MRSLTQPRAHSQMRRPLRTQIEEAYRILELMDLVMGFCAASQRIWIDEPLLEVGSRWQFVEPTRCYGGGLNEGC